MVIEDFAPQEEMDRLSAALARAGGGTVVTFTRFFDEFWGAEAAVDAAFRDAENSDADALFGSPLGGPNRHHVNALLKLGDIEISDARAMEFGMPEVGTYMAVLADAGLGKSELLRWHEWRYASFYRNALEARKTTTDLPPVALRVPLRDFKSLSLDYIAHALSQPAGEGRTPLPRITSGDVLRELVTQGRLILFLDGLDEIAADSSTVDSGILEWLRVVRDGGHFVLTSREGHEASRGSIARRFNPSETAVLQPMDPTAAISLLMKRGASGTNAERVVDALSGAAAGIPLFLLLANHVGLHEAPPAEVSKSRTLVLLELIRLFCERDEGRLGVTADEQISVLTQIAEWILESGAAKQDELLSDLGIAEDDPLARIIRNPHALLVNDNGIIEFKFPEFSALFRARAIAQAWQSFGFNAVAGLLRSKKLDEQVSEYLARLIHPAVISGAWASSELDDALILRRNLLAVALARVADVAHAENSNMRAAELAKVLGSRAITNVSLSGLYLERFDFADWQMRRLHGSGGTLSFCDHLWRTDHDDTVRTLSTDGCDFTTPDEHSTDLSVGIDRLRRLVRPLRRKNSGAIVTIMNKDEARDPRAWEELTHFGMARIEGKAAGARWVLNGDGVRVLTSFSAADSTGGPAVDQLVQSDGEIRAIVERMSKR